MRGAHLVYNLAKLGIRPARISDREIQDSSRALVMELVTQFLILVQNTINDYLLFSKRECVSKEVEIKLQGFNVILFDEESKFLQLSPPGGLVPFRPKGVHCMKIRDFSLPRRVFDIVPKALQNGWKLVHLPCLDMTPHERVYDFCQRPNVSLEQRPLLRHSPSDRGFRVALVPDCILSHVRSACFQRLLEFFLLEQCPSQAARVRETGKAVGTAPLKRQTRAAQTRTLASWRELLQREVSFRLRLSITGTTYVKGKPSHAPD